MMDWSKKYELKILNFKDLKDKIEIPKFQRGLVWSNKKKVEFIKTLKAGLPIGVLLVSPRNDKYLVIDGLQRFTTMLSYSEDYFKYIDTDEIEDDDLLSIINCDDGMKDIFENSNDVVKKSYLDKMRSIIVEVIREKSVNAFERTQVIAQKFIDQIAFINNDVIEKIKPKIFDIDDKISKKADISNVEIPLIIFEGSDSDLCNVFQKLNQEGVKLSKYDVFAATWIDHYVNVKDDEDFIQFVIDKYETAKEESELDIADYDPDSMKQTGMLTVFEYAYALGKAIMNNCNTLFPKVDQSKIESCGFIIMAELMGLSYQDMGNLANKCDEYKKLDYIAFKNAIVESAINVENYLGDYIKSPTDPNKTTGRTSLCCHSELQIISYIIVVFKMKYKLSIENGLEKINTNNKNLDKIKSYIKNHYLYDILRKHWSGTGDSKLEEIIAFPESCRYTKDVSKEDFKRVLLEWLGGFDQKKSVKVSQESRLFLNYLLINSDSYKTDQSYDVEHCVPKEQIKKYLTDKGVTVPVSTPCNMVYIPRKDNRSKGDLTYYEKQKIDPDTYTLNKDALSELSYPTEEELSFVNSTDTLTEENYRKFLDDRRKYLADRFIKLIYKYI